MPRLFLGNLGYDCRTRDLEDLFKNYGPVSNINVKGKYGFVEIDNKEDAEDAIHDLDGKSFNGGRIRIEFSNAYTGDYRGGSSRGRSRSRDRYDAPPRFSDGRFRKSNYRIVVDNLSSRTSWQDLKDYMGKAGEVTYTSVKRPRAGEGLVEFADRHGMERALRDLDDTRLDGNYIRLSLERRSGSRSRSRSRGRRHSRSRSRSRSRRSRRSRSTSRRSRSRSRPRRSSRSQSRTRRSSGSKPRKSRSRSNSR